MTSSFPGDSMTALHPDDIFLVNRSVDADGKFETYKVPYSEVSKAFRGPIGPDGELGATGATGNQGVPGTSVKVLGAFGDYDELIAGKPAPNDEGDIYVVGDDYSQAGWPGNGILDENDQPEKNVAYVWAIGAGPGGTNAFVRLGPLTGPQGPTGPHYTDVSIDVRPDDASDSTTTYDYTIQFRDNNAIVPNLYDANLPDVDLEVTDVRGATGATGPYYDSVYTSKDEIVQDGMDADGHPTFKKDYRITFAKSAQSDPDNVLINFETQNLIGATGPGVGEVGPQGPMGLFYDSIGFTEDAFEVTDYPGDTPYGAVTATYSGTGVNSSLTPYTTPNIRGPRGPRGEITNLGELENLLINLYPPGTPEGENSPWVHKGKNCGEDFYDEDVFGQKTFCHTIGFDPCEINREVMHWKVGDGRDFKMFFRKNLRGSNGYLDGFSIQRTSTGSPGLTVGFETGSGSPQIGVKVANPYHAIDAKGVIAAQQLVAKQNPGQAASTGDFVAYRTYGIESGLETFQFKQSSSKSGPCRFKFTGNARFEYYGYGGGFKIQKSGLPTDKGGFLRLDGDQVKYSNNSKFAVPSISDPDTTVTTEFDGTRALEVVKALKPRIVNTDGTIFVAPVQEDIQTDIMGELKRTSEGEVTVETVVSMLLLSIQKLEQRISALESA